MLRGSLKLDKARNAISELNEQFHLRSLLDARFYAQLEARGFDCKNSVLVQLVPDGSDTYIGELIAQDGRMFSFDIDLGDAAHTEWTDKTDELEGTKRRFSRSRPWLPTLVALELWCAIERGAP